MSRDRAKRLVAAIYSAAAARVYEPLVVKGTFRLLGGNLPELVLEQGRLAVAVARGGPILDMPVGTAHFTIAMAPQHEGLIVGTDIAAGMVRQAAAAGRRRGAANMSVVQADAHRLPFEDGAFAAVLCTNGLQVIPGLSETVRELARVLAPQGSLFVSLLSLALGSLLPERAAERLPTLLRSYTDVEEEIAGAGLMVTGVRRERLATLIEAVKPAP